MEIGRAEPEPHRLQQDPPEGSREVVERELARKANENAAQEGNNRRENPLNRHRQDE